MFSMQLVIALFRKGVIVLPSGDEMFPATKGAIRQVLGKVQTFLDRSNTLVLTLWAALYALAFLAIRQVVWTVFSTFDNVWIIAGICGLFAAPFIIPGALGSIFRTLKNSMKK